jgi:hypothetical protein
MKKIITLFALCLCTLTFGQHKVAKKVAEYKALKTTFNHFVVLTPENEPIDSDVSRAVNKATLAQINTASVNDIVANGYEAIELEIPYQGATILVEMYKVNPFNRDFHIDTDKATNIGYDKGVHYRGIVKGDENSVASFSFFGNELNGIVSANEISNLVIARLDKPNNTTDYVVYSDSDLRVMSGFNCSVKDDGSEHDHDSDTSRNVLTERCVTMYFEIDYNLFQQNNNNTATTTNWMTSVFNNVQTLYENEGITVSLKSIYIWTSQDPYEGIGDDSGAYLNEFNMVRPVFDGDVGQLVGIDEGGLGGVAATIDGLCSQNNYSYSDVNYAFSSVPTFSWTVQVITHEMGHLLGSRHTHACVWNGNNTSIDGCGTQAGYNEGNCAQGPIPSPAVKGTIMSYCHLIGGVGINFNNGFGPQPSDAIYTNVEGSTCLSTDCINTCINTVLDIAVTNPTPTSATITWNDLGNATSWQVSVSAFASGTDNWVTVDTNSYTTTAPLNMNTYYKVRIRPLCESATSTYRQAIFATPGLWCNGVTITDTGGATGTYGNMQHYVRVLIPNLPQKKIRLVFTQFNLEADYDFLTVYDGADTSGLTWGVFTGTTITSPIESVSPDGALTLEFFSDQAVVEAGYVATVSCQQNLGLDDIGQNIDFTYFPNPATGAVNIISNIDMQEILVYNIQGQLLHHSKNNGMDKKVDISAFATGTYFFKLKFGEKEANFKILKN